MTVHRAALRAALRARHPWIEGAGIEGAGVDGAWADGAGVDDPAVGDLGVGPAAVEAGECDRCGAEARLVTTCGPGAVSLGRRCAAEAGVDAWCAGHADEAAAALAALAALPANADDVARLWWVATGEVRLDPDLVAGLRRRALPAD